MKSINWETTPNSQVHYCDLGDIRMSISVWSDACIWLVRNELTDESLGSGETRTLEEAKAQCERAIKG